MSDDAVDRAQRVLEEGISTDFSKAMSYGAYLDLDTLLAAQHPRAQVRPRGIRPLVPAAQLCRPPGIA